MCSFASSTRRSCSARLGKRTVSPPAGAASAGGSTGRASSAATVAGVAVEHLGGAGHVVEAQEEVGDDEPALRDVRAVGRQRHGRLELRDVVVGEVADDRRVERLRLVQRDEPRAAADERVPAEPALVDRLEQERRAALQPQVQVRLQRRDEVGVDRGGESS